MNYCYNCGAKIIEKDQKFCIKCGINLQEHEEKYKNYKKESHRKYNKLENESYNDYLERINSPVKDTIASDEEIAEESIAYTDYDPLKDYNENELTISNLEDDEHEKYIELKDTFGRSYLFNKDKAEIKDQFGNTFVFDKDKTELQDQFGNDYLFDNDKIELNDKFGNKIMFDKSSCEFKDQFGHTVSFSSGNFKCKDAGTNELNFTGAGAQIKTMKFRVGNGLHPMVLGTPLVAILTKLCAEIQKITVDTPSGISSPPLNAQAFSEISASLATALSLISSTD